MAKEITEAKLTGRHAVFLVDDHVVVRQSIAMVVNQQPDMRVCGEAEDAAKALGAIVATKPEVVVTDLTLKASSGLELIRNLKAQLPRLPILVLSMHDEALYGELALHAGALGYLTKTQPVEQVLAAIRRVLNGHVSVSDALSSKMLLRRMGRQVEAGAAPVERLSDREREVFQLIGQWKGTHQIAEELHLSVKTVEFYREQIKEKLDLGTGTELLRYATLFIQGEQGR